MNESIIEYRDTIYSKKTPREQLELLNSKETEDFLRKNFKYSYFIDSGARGSWDQARQIIFSRGYISNFKGEILPTPIKGNLIEGLNPKEFFLSTYGCRKGLLDTALNTGVAGYLSRKLIFACSNLQKHATLEDCGTKNYLQVYVASEKKARMLVMKWYKNPETKEEELITKDNYSSLVGKTIEVRSPIYCSSEKICHKCYGELHTLLHSPFIGIIAAQALGEVGTQLVLRVFHTSGVAQIKDSTEESNPEESMKQEDIIGDLSTASQILHVKDKSMKEKDLVEALFKVYSESREIHHVHFESIISQLMWIGSIKWRLHPRRKDISPMFISIQSVPERESWLLGLGFSSPKKNIIRALLKSGNYRGIFDAILLGKRI